MSQKRKASIAGMLIRRSAEGRDAIEKLWRSGTGGEDEVESKVMGRGKAMGGDA